VAWLAEVVGRCIVIALAAATAACGPLDPCDADTLTAGSFSTCPLPGWDERPFEIAVPAAAGPRPLLIVLHGGGGDPDGAFAITCPPGEDDAPTCLDEQALARGYIVVAPNGTGLRPLRNSRSWNAGGGNDDYYCSTGAACHAGVDDLHYFDDLLAAVGAIANYERDRVYVTGFSNGSSMSHRLACQRSSVITAVAPVSGPNQHAESGGACDASVPLLHIHGTEDPCAPWQDATDASCSVATLRGLKVGVPRTIEGWRVRNGCDDTSSEANIVDVDPGDGTTAKRESWENCTDDLELIEIEGGGHTWPGGRQYLDVGSIGRLNRDFNASETILNFFDAHPTP